jgi:hypothetical protein
MIHARDDYNRIQDPENKIPEQEPVFLIRGQDLIGWKLVELWADYAEVVGCSKDIIAKARLHARRMRNWPKKKVADI